MNYKTIWHLGGWNRNLGDAVIKASIRENFQKLSKDSLNFVYIDYQNTKVTEELIESMNNSADLLLIGGGGAVFNRPEDKSESGWQFNIKTENISKIKIPIAVFGIGFNQFKYDYNGFKKGTFEHLIETQKVSSHFSTRDAGSKRELIGRGLDQSIDIVPDSGSFLSGSDLNIKIPGVNNKRVKIGVNWVMDRVEKTFPYPAKENKTKLLKTFLDVFNDLIEKYNAQIIQIEHIKGLDTSITEYLETALGADNFISIEKNLSFMFPPNDVTSKFLVDIYKQMDLIIGMRGHSNIIPFGTRTKFIALSSHDKNRFFLEEIDRQEDFLIIEEILRLEHKESVKNIIRMIEKKFNEPVFGGIESIKKVAEKRKEFEEAIKNILSLI